MIIRTRRFATIALTLVAVNISACSATKTRKAAHDPQRASVERFVKIRAPWSGTLAANGNFYYIDLKDGVQQLHKRTGQPGQGVALTNFADGASGYTVSDDGKWIVISASTGGDEQLDLYLMSTATEKVTPLFVDRQTVFGSVLWRRDSKAFAYRANKDVKSDFNIYIYDLDSKANTKIWDKPGYWYPLDFTADARKLLVGQYVSASESYAWEVNLPDKGARPLMQRQEKFAFFPVGYDNNDNYLYAVTDFQADRKILQRIDINGGYAMNVLPQFKDHEIDTAVMNQNRDIMAVTVNVDGYGELHLYSLPSFKPLSTPDIPKGLVRNLGFQGSTLVYSLTNTITPGLIYKWNVDQPDSRPVAMTTADTQDLDLAAFSLPELIHYQSDDGMEIPAFLFLPPDHKRGEPIPFIVSYHGGPEGQYRPGLSRHFLYFMSRGFGVLAPNVRGSSGYGTAYLEADNYKKRMLSVQDGVAAARWLVDNGYSRPKLIGAYGGSYGGFMTVAVITQAPNLFGAACNVVGIVNFKTFLERTKAYRRALREAEYGPLSDPEFLESISPIYLVDRIRTPVLIAHGKNDPRVPVYEAEQLYDEMKKRGQEAELLIFDDEGHGFRKEANRIVFYTRLADFFEKHLQ